jgi:hypothetical protein
MKRVTPAGAASSATEAKGPRHSPVLLSEVLEVLLSP